MRKTNFLLIISFTFLASGCQKDNEEVTRKDMLCGKNWVLISETINPALDVDGTLITDLYSQYATCDKDDIGKFNTNGTYTLEEGKTKCEGTDPQVYETGTWSFNSDETIIIVTPSSGSVDERKIQGLTANKLILTEEIINANIMYKITSTYQSI